MVLILYRFSSVTERFFMELNARGLETNILRNQSLSIINGMRYLKLGVFVFTVYFLN
jgi:Cell morphogenesis N-terminal